MNINLTTPINTLGFGILGVNVLKSLSEKGHSISLWPLGGVEAHQRYHDHIHKAVEQARLFDGEAPSLRIWHPFDLAQHVGRGLRAAYAVFELDRFTTQELHHLKSQDVVIAPSKWAKDVLEKNGVKPENVQVAPFGVDTSIFRPIERPSVEGAPTVFFHIGKWEIRKGADALCEGFNKAFSPKDNVQLVLNCFNPFEKPGGNERWAALFMNSPMGKAGKITVLPKRLQDQEQVAQLINQCDCGAFPALGEAWNFELHESLACGKHVITTNFSGHTAFVSPENAFLIEVEKTASAYDGLFFFGQGEWADFGENQMEQLVNHLRTVHKRKQEGSLGVNTKGVETARKFSWAHTADLLVSILGGEHASRNKSPTDGNL